MRTLRLLGLTALLAVMGYMGGVAATALRPIVVETDYYRAEVSIAPGFGDTSSVRAPTVFGDITLDFAGPVPAPGIEARVQVREEITQLFTTGFEVDVNSFTPNSEQIREALTTGLRDLSLTFLAGVAITEALIVSVWLVGRGRWPSRRVLTCVGTAAVTAMAVPAATAVSTYNQNNFSSFEVTSLLGTVHDNVNMLDDIQGASEQATPYIYNLLALSDALQNEFVPAEARDEPAARILLVSDIHGMNYYALMQRIVVTENIDAVIDTGDLVNWGTVEEGEMAGIFDSIEDLEVPYIFARGNHDATSRFDERVLNRMAQIPNVVLVEPTDGQFVEARVNGVRVAGFNDWRYWGDSNEDVSDIQTAAAHRFRDAVAEWGAPDVLITHSPYAAHRAPTNGIRVAGHMHVPDLDGSLVQVGTFTGGGLFNHFQIRSAPDGDDEMVEEAVSAPYAFDILGFGEDCAVQTLTRYTYRNLVQGRPQYDGVSVVNGSRLMDPQEDRSCGQDLGFETLTIEQPAAEDEDGGEPGEDDPQGAGPAPIADPLIREEARQRRSRSAVSGSALDPGEIGSD